jgi:hypothetical protein
VTDGSTANGSKAQALKDLNWPTLILIMFSGGANLLTTQKNSADRDYQIQQAVSQIRDLHGALDDFEKRQKQGLDNQTRILENDTVLLKEVHSIVLQFEDLKRKDRPTEQ